MCDQAKNGAAWTSLFTGALAELFGLEHLGTAIIELADLILGVLAPILLMLQGGLIVVQVPVTTKCLTFSPQTQHDWHGSTRDKSSHRHTPQQLTYQGALDIYCGM